MTKKSVPMRVFTTTGVQVLKGLDRAERSVVAAHWNAARRFLEYGDESALLDVERATAPAPGEPVRVGGHALEFDLDAIERVAFAGDVRFESIYEGTS